MSDGLFTSQLDPIAFGSIHWLNDFFSVCDVNGDDAGTGPEEKRIAAGEIFKRMLVTNDISWMTAFTALSDTDRANDSLIVWDNDGTALRPLPLGLITDLLYSLGSGKVRNPLFHGGDPTGVASSKTAFTNMFSALADGDLVIIPPGVWNLASLGSLAFTESRITFLGIGQPVIDMGNGSFVLDGNQSDITFQGINFKNFGECLAPASIDDTKTNFRVVGCKFFDSTSSGSHHAIKMWCRVKGATITDNVIDNIGSSSGSAYGIVLGEKGDNSTRTPDPTAEYDYGFDGSTFASAEGNIVVANNRITKLRGNSDEVTAVLVDGWRGNIVNNVIGDISSTSTGGVGIYTRGHEFNVLGNNVADCSHAHVVSKGAPTDPSVGNTGHVNIQGNIFRRTMQSNSYGTVELTVGNAKVANNKFIRIQMTQTAGAIVYDTGQGNVEVHDNEFYKCKGRHTMFPKGSFKAARRNKVLDPVGNGSSEFEIFVAAPTDDDAYMVAIEDNEVYLTSGYAGTSSIYVVRVYPTAGQLIAGLSVKRNAVRGLADFRTVKTTTPVYVVQALVRTDGQSQWHIEDNYADEWNASYTILNDVQLSGASAWPTDFVQRARVLKPVTMSADFTFNQTMSGLVLDNLGQTADRVISLPAPRDAIELTAINRAAGYKIYFDPAGSEKIGDGGSGKYLRIDKLGRVKIRGLNSGQYEVVEMGSWDDPGSSGTPVPGIVWET